MEVLGTRVGTHEEFWEGAPGTYMWVNLKEGDDRFRTVFLRCPKCGGHMFLAYNPKEGRVHEPEEHDGKLTLRPLPGNSNSLKHNECGWHGYIYEDVFTPV